MFRMRIPGYCWFTVGLLAGMAMRSCGCALRREINVGSLRAQATDATAALAAQAGHKIRRMGRRLAHKLR